MRCLVTGSSGLLGNCLVTRLRERGEQLRLLDVEPPSDPSDGSEFVRADMRDAAAVEAAAQAVEVIYHLAAGQRMKPQFAGLSEQEIFDMNLQGVAHVLRAAERAHVRKVVFISSSGIYGIPRTLPCGEDHPTRPLGAYGESKLQAEQLCRDALARGLDVTSFRPMSLFGPRMSGIFVLLFEWVRTGRPVYMLGSGANRVQMVSAWDLAEACVRAVETPASRGGFFNIGSAPESVPSVYEQVQALIKHAGSPSRIVHIPVRLLRNAARALNAVGLSPIVPEHYLLADSNFVLDISHARRVLGWEPRLSNVELMNDAYDWYVRHGQQFRPRPHPILRLLEWFTPARVRAA
jgi:nucleoside-diphosphate-sugar epimerase